jgi:hypothetical protein
VAVPPAPGFSCLLAYELSDGRLKLLDGHLRRDLDPNMEVDVEVLDVDDDEARALLLSLDPLAALAETQDQIQQRLMELTPTDSLELQVAWQAAAEAVAASKRIGSIPEQFLVLITCDDETQQVALLERFKREGLDCKAVLS